MNYPECLRYLEQVQTLGIKFGLDNVRAVLQALENPEKLFPSVVIAGSNGKGSVCAMLSRILTVHGFKTGLYTSPHLIHPEERIRIDGIPVGREAFCRNLTAVRNAIESLLAESTLLTPPTYFETMTCQALLCFAEAKAELAVLEVGMGGRFDATNVVDRVASVITTISAEHQKFLGDTLAQIAFEKAGIVMKGIPVVCGVEPDEAFDVIKARAHELKAPFIPVFREGRRFDVQTKSNGYRFYFGEKEQAGNTSIRPDPAGSRQPEEYDSTRPWKSSLPEEADKKNGKKNDGSFPDKEIFPSGGTEKDQNTEEDRAYVYSPSLLGLHQGKNAAIAIRAAEVIGEVWKPLEKTKIIEGIETTSWPGRLEIVSKDPLVFMDGAHNEEGAKALLNYAEEFMPRPLTLVFGAMRDKAVGRIAEILFPAADRIILTGFSYFKAFLPNEILARTPEILKSRCILEPDSRLALEKAMSPISSEKSGKGIPSVSKGSVLIAGSLFLVGEMKPLFQNGQNK